MSPKLHIESFPRPRTTVALAVGAAAMLAVAGCSASSSSPSSSPSASTSSVSPTASPTTASPTATPTTAKPTATQTNITNYQVESGGTVIVAGAGAPKFVTEGGKMVVNKNGGSGTGVLAAAIDVASSCCAAYSSPWTLRLVTNGDGVVQSGSLNGAAGKYVLGKGGKINFLTTGSTTTLVTDTPIPAMRGTETPTTIKINITGKR